MSELLRGWGRSSHLDTMQQVPARRFEDLRVWQKAHAFVLEIYHLTKNFPKTETFGLVAQMRRAAISVPANIAEGFKKRCPPDKARFLNIAEGSLQECRYYLILASDLDYCDATEASRSAEETSRLLESYANAIRRSI